MEQSLNYDSYSDADHAGTHRQLAPGPERDTAEIAADFNTLMREGYVIIEGLLSADQKRGSGVTGAHRQKQF